MSNKNKERLRDMNMILTEFLTSSPKLSITELNTLHYSAAVVLAGAVRKPTQLRSRKDPDSWIKEQIEKVRKWIGKLTATSKNNKLTQKVRKFIGNRPIISVLIEQKMKLAALAKKLKVRVANRKRYTNNKLFRHNKKAFYTNLRTKDKLPTENNDPPNKDDVSKFWGSLWSFKGAHNPNAKWLRDEKKK